MLNFPFRIFLCLLMVEWCGTEIVNAQDSAPQLDAAQQIAIAEVDARADELKAVNQSIWKFAEVGLQEKRSSKLLIDKLEAEGFAVESGLSQMPTAFVASYGKGKPVIGILAEYDALPGLSQKISPNREAEVEGAAGHGCGHCALGTGALGAVLAVKKAMQEKGLPGTIRLYGTPAEETVIGKVYMALDGQFDDLDVCLHWHPSDKNMVWGGSSKALVSAKFTFKGLAAHSSGSPEAGRSALDAVELMNVGANFMREHIKEDARLHYVIVNGGGQPNVVPPEATVWYFIRADSHADVEANFKWLKDIAKGAALMSRTSMSIQIDTDCHELIPNTALMELIHKEMKAIPTPKYTAEEQTFAARLIAQMPGDTGKPSSLYLREKVEPLSGKSSKGSTDVGDISWKVPTGGLRTVCFANGSPGHSWQNVACVGTSIGEKGLVYAAKVLAATALSLLQDDDLVVAAKADFDRRMKDRPYRTLIPPGQAPPKDIRNVNQ